MISEKIKVNITRGRDLRLLVNYNESIDENPEETEAILQGANSRTKLYKHSVTALLIITG